MWDFAISRSLGLLLRSAGTTGLRLAVFAGLAVVIALATLIAAWAGHLVGMAGSDAFQIGAGSWGALLGFLVALGALFFLRDHLLFRLTLPHALVLDHLARGQGRLGLPAARRSVAARFGRPAPLMVLDRLVQKAIREISGLIGPETVRLPLAGLEDAGRTTRFWLRRAEAQADLVVLAQALPLDGDPFTASRQALLRVSAIAPSILSNGAWLAVFRWALLVPVFLLMIPLAAAVVNLLPSGGLRAILGFAAVFAWAVKGALLDPFTLASLLQLLPDAASSDAAEDPEIRSALEDGSPAFRGLAERALAWESP